MHEYTGLVSTGILAVLIMGLFWNKTTTKGAIYGVLASLPIALILKLAPLGLPFLDQMFYTLILTIVIIVGVSLTTNPHHEDPKAIQDRNERRVGKECRARRRTCDGEKKERVKREMR